jgi:hypothetical protein
MEIFNEGPNDSKMLIYRLFLYRSISTFSNYIKKSASNVNIPALDNKVGSRFIASCQGDDII